MVCMKYLIAILAIAGLYVSVRALQVHYLPPGAALPCAVSEHWDCGEVNQGKYSVFPPKDLMTEYDENGQYHPNKAACADLADRHRGLLADPAVRSAGADPAGAGDGAHWLLLRGVPQGYIEAYIITKWCIYCVWSMAIMTAILALSMVAVVLRRRRRAESMVAVLLADGE